MKNKRERGREKKDLSRVLRRFRVQLYLSCGFYRIVFLLSKKEFRGCESCELEKLEHRFFRFFFENYFCIDIALLIAPIDL